ncbi:pilus assembly protein PilX [Corticibacter populi]|nr:pilus assembly protein PilX [Corticibacter populi]
MTPVVVPPGQGMCGGQQRGMALIFALLVLLALILAGVALVRSVNTGALVAGNLAFKQDATVTADRAAQQAISVLYARLAADADSLDADLPDIGYYASTDGHLDPTGYARADDASSRRLIQWDSDYCSGYSSYASCAYTPSASTVSINGNEAGWIVFRLCDASGSYGSGEATCAAASSAASTGDCQGAINYENQGTGCAGTASSPYYRILVRTKGPRNTVSYTETIVHF